MGHDTAVEVDDVHWFAHYGPVEMRGECPHECEHRTTRVIAWGPSLTVYEYIECGDCGCRAWEAALPTSRGGIEESHPWREPA